MRLLEFVMKNIMKMSWRCHTQRITKTEIKPAQHENNLASEIFESDSLWVNAHIYCWYRMDGVIDNCSDVRCSILSRSTHENRDRPTSDQMFNEQLVEVVCCFFSVFIIRKWMMMMMLKNIHIFISSIYGFQFSNVFRNWN